MSSWTPYETAAVKGEKKGGRPRYRSAANITVASWAP